MSRTARTFVHQPRREASVPVRHQKARERPDLNLCGSCGRTVNCNCSTAADDFDFEWRLEQRARGLGLTLEEYIDATQEEIDEIEDRIESESDGFE